MGDEKLGNALLSAMIDADLGDREDAWRELGRLLTPAALSDTELAAAWEAARRARSTDALARLATALGARAVRDPRLFADLSG